MKKVLILILAYNAEKHIVKVLDRLPAALWNNPEYAAEVVVIDDCSKDDTSRVARARFDGSPYPIRLLRNKVNQGYGGNQKVGYTYAIEQGYDAVVMLHGDGQYPPEHIPAMVAPIIGGEADAVFGSRMINKKEALAGGMPLYKFMGNMVLTRLQNLMLGSGLSEFHSGFRAYSVAALRRIPFQYNSDVFHFDTDIIIQLVDNGMTIKEIAIPTHYGDEVCHVNGMRYARDVMLSTLLSRVQKLGIFYAPKFDYTPVLHYADKSHFPSSHSFALAQVRPGERVLDIGGEQHVAARLRAQGCQVTCIDAEVVEDLAFRLLGAEHFDVVLLPDILEHMRSPERFLDALHSWCAASNPRIIVTAPNIAFFIQRVMLLFGQFNYGRHGTLDMTHTRLFTFGSLRRILANGGFTVISAQGIPAPFILALGDTWLARLLLRMNIILIKLSKSLFSFQIAMTARPRPTLESLVQQAVAHGKQVK